jgi:hypothetical protein
MLLGGPRGTFTLDGSLFSGALRGVHVPQPTNKSRKQSSGKMSLQEAERLRQLLRRAKPADLSEHSVLQRIGNAVANAIYRRPKPSSSAKEQG